MKINELTVEIGAGTHSELCIGFTILTISAELAAFAHSFRFTQSSLVRPCDRSLHVITKNFRPIETLKEEYHP